MQDEAVVETNQSLKMKGAETKRSACTMQEDRVDTTLTLGIGCSGTKKTNWPIQFHMFQAGEEVEHMKHFNRESETHGESSTRDERTRKRLKLTSEQLHVLDRKFVEKNTITQAEKQDLAKRLNLTPYQVEIWFQNRRARNKVKQADENYEFIKMRCENMGVEIHRLRRELHEARLSATKPPREVTQEPSLCAGCKKIMNEGQQPYQSGHGNQPLATKIIPLPAKEIKTEI